MEKKITVLIADDHTLLRQGLVKLLELHDTIDVVGQAVNGQQAVDLLREIQPDVVLMDINMPGLNGIEATRQLRKEYPNLPVLALTIHDDEEYVSEMIRAGASGYILKDSEPGSVVQAITRLAMGESYFPSYLMEKVMERFHLLVREQSEEQPLHRQTTEEMTKLTNREYEVLQCIVNGMGNKEIAQALYISEKTVKNHITNVFRKLNVFDRTQAAVYAVQHGIVKAGD